MNKKNNISNHIDSFLNSYSQIFFSSEKLFGSILFAISFFDPWSGLMGAFSVLLSLFIAHQLGFDKKSIQSGIYSYNSLLTGLGIGLYFQPSLALYVFAFFVSLIVLFLSVSLSKHLSNYGLPFLSIPFILGIWLVDLSSSSFTYLGLSDRNIYQLNEWYQIGGQSVIDFYNQISEIPLLYSLKVYYLSLGAIFFQYQVLAGFVISIGLLIHSRISLLLSLIGFYTAWLFYYILGASLYDLSYSYIGFNFILTSIALGGFYLIPNRSSFGWMLLVLPLVVLITVASIELLSYFSLGIYALPFNLVVILFLYMNKLRRKQKYHLKETLIQHNNPEKNLYFSLNSEDRFVDLKYRPIGLPVSGEWKISQAHDGEHTHQKDWRHAWDFIMTDKNGEQFQDKGDKLTDYFCYQKNTIAVDDGIVEEIVKNVPDNDIGENNLEKNWGNTIIIKHNDYLYSKYSHLQKDSIKLNKGEWIKKGEVIGKVGNSGRSPYPHLHFQMQTTPYIGSKTINYPISSYVLKMHKNKQIKIYDYPKINDIVSNPQKNELLSKFLKWDIGRKIDLEVEQNRETKKLSWNIQTDIFKNTYFHCKESDSYAYFYQDGNMSYFKNYIGDKNAALYHFFLAFHKTHAAYYQNSVIEDQIALHLSPVKKGILLLQDFIAPFYIFLKAKYQHKQLSVDDDLSPSLLKLESKISFYRFDQLTIERIYHITINNRSRFEINLDQQLKINQIK